MVNDNGDDIMQVTSVSIQKFLKPIDHQTKPKHNAVRNPPTSSTTTSSPTNLTTMNHHHPCNTKRTFQDPAKSRKLPINNTRLLQIVPSSSSSIIGEGGPHTHFLKSNKSFRRFASKISSMPRNECEKISMKDRDEKRYSDFRSMTHERLVKIQQMKQLYIKSNKQESVSSRSKK